MSSPISILIPTRNRSAILAKCLAALPEGVQGFDPPEVIVADDCSADETAMVVEAFGRASGWPVLYIRQERAQGANAARNMALKLARGNIIVLIDDDAITADGWLAKLLSALSEESPVVTGAIRLTIEGAILGRHRKEVSSYLSEVLTAPRGIFGETVPVACNMAAYRWVFDRALFDEQVKPPTEEGDWLRRTGVNATFVHDALVWHYKTAGEAQLTHILRLAWLRGSEGGWWVRERAKLPSGWRFYMACQSFRTCVRAFGHAVWGGCWGGIVVGFGELARALAVIGLINRGARTPESWR
jgi:glycosyltransferase involved in cell wall biosynthesis